MKENAAGLGADLMMSDPSGTPMMHSFQRTGCMAAFESFSQFENYFDEILDLLEVRISIIEIGYIFWYYNNILQLVSVVVN